MAPVAVPVIKFVLLGLQQAVDLVVHHAVNVGPAGGLVKGCYVVDKFSYDFFLKIFFLYPVKKLFKADKTLSTVPPCISSCHSGLIEVLIRKSYLIL